MMPCSPAMANGTWEMRIRRRIEKEPNDQLSQELPRVLLELHASLKPDGVLFSSSPLGRNEEGWNARRYGVCYDLHTWRRYVSHAGFVELSHYYRPAGLPRETQPWLASVCVGKDSGRFGGGFHDDLHVQGIGSDFRAVPYQSIGLAGQGRRPTPKQRKIDDREMTNLCRCARSVPISIEMDADLPSLDQLRCNAAECIRLAEAARTSQHKSLFIEMADRWLTLAEHAAREDRLNGGSLFRDR